KKSAEIFKLCGPSVALIRVKVGSHEGGGTGFMVRPGILATNAHVIDSALMDQTKVYFVSAKDAEERKKAYSAKILYFDPKRDLAFLSIDEKAAKPLRIAKTYEVETGQDITVIGCPGHATGEQLPNTVTKGNMGTKTKVRSMPFYQMSIAVNPGNSGGPV